MESESTTSLYVNPALGLTIAVGKQMEQIRQVQLNMVKQYNEIVRNMLNSPILEIVKNTREMQLSLARSIQNALNPLAVQFEPVSQIQEAEVIEENSSLFDLTVSIEGRFFLKDELINTITTNSKHGKLLELLLKNNENYVTDEEVNENIGVMDEGKGIGYIRRDLKRALKKFALKIDLYRDRQRGYRLLEISRLPN